ncbi:MAG TPA: phosphoribosylglycinamide formyltransferase [Metalysinibacillus jejuensis]|uniref:Phosphoribosylglycinamide formyltransferase n=1 Tax=Metalysinibacillus jejuensis TaxID=914327 RepID=A0A921NC55_9BACL|nr:phosphoribosylglycinamide formyltransferase [Metalysinibacillus jejuensis]HJH10843.1 phosphoribosylglycinamide formyltransferase [Metalysinibacillus jejuensis]
MAPKIAVFASGSGSNFQALHNAIEAQKLNAELVVMVTDKPEAFVVERANKVGVEALAFSPKTYDTKAAYEQAVIAALQQRGVEWIVLAGYMRLVSEVLLQAYPNRIVNIHPSLLPSFPGKDAIGQAIAHGVKVTGVTVHYVDEGMDTGPIIAQRAVNIIEGDVEATEAAIHRVEHELYTEALNQILK